MSSGRLARVRVPWSWRSRPGYGGRVRFTRCAGSIVLVLVLGSTFLAGCDLGDPDAFAVRFDNDLSSPVVLALCHSDHSAKCAEPYYRDHIAPGGSYEENISTDLRTEWAIESTDRRLLPLHRPLLEALPRRDTGCPHLGCAAMGSAMCEVDSITLRTALTASPGCDLGGGAAASWTVGSLSAGPTVCRRSRARGRRERACPACKPIHRAGALLRAGASASRTRAASVGAFRSASRKASRSCQRSLPGCVRWRP